MSQRKYSQLKESEQIPGDTSLLTVCRELEYKKGAVEEDLLQHREKI